MPFSAPPTILLAAASLALLTGLFFQRRAKRLCEIYSLLVLLMVGYALAIEPVQIYDPSNEATVRSAFRNDSLACCEQWLVLIFGLLSGIALFDSPRREQDATNTFGFLLFVLAGLMLTAGSNDFISLGLSLEIVRLSVRALGQLDDDALKETRWLEGLASGAMWIGVAVLSNGTAATQFDAVRTVLTIAYDPGVNQTAIGAPSKLILLGAGLISISLFARIHLVPFSLVGSSFPPRHSSPGQGIGMLAAQFAGWIALTRLVGCVFVGLSQPLLGLFMTVTLATFALTAVLISRGSSSGARSIPHFVTSLMLLHSGWLVIGLMIASTELQQLAIPWGEFSPKTETLAIIVFLQLTGLLGCGVIFGVLGRLAQQQNEVAFLEDVKGLGTYAKGTALMLIVGMATLAGFPLTAGFWGRWMVLLAGNNVHSKSASRIFEPHHGLRFVLLAGVIATCLAGLVVIRMAREMFLESPLARRSAGKGRGVTCACVIAALVCLLLGIAPQAALGPLRSIRSPRTLAPDAPQRGSGKNLLGSRRG